MRDRELYARILGLDHPWTVGAVELDLAGHHVTVHLTRLDTAPLLCPECQRACPGYDALPRRWRHLDTCQFQTILAADIPRCHCPEHGVKQVAVPWATPHSRFTALFERLAIDWMQVAGRQATARQLGLSWDQADGIMQRAVERGLQRREAVIVPLLGVDEKSFRGREFVTIACDLEAGTVLHVAPGRSGESLQECYRALTAEQRAGVAAVAMDLHQPYVAATRAELPDAAIVFDKFHIAQLANAAVEEVRRQEAPELAARGDDRLKRTRYLWLRNPQTETREQRRSAAAVRASHLKTARAWAMKEELMDLFRYVQPGRARRYFLRWYGWASRSRLKPLVRLAKSLRSRLDILLNYCRWPITNAASEALNSTIQWIKYTARGFRSRDGFRRAIFFHCGGLQLYP